MPKPSQSPRPRRLASGRRHDAAVSSGALIVIDHVRLQGAAWSEFHTARKRLERTTRDLHRHEETDVPAYDAWLHRTFPLLVTALRELHAEVSEKSQSIKAVQARAIYAGGSLKRLWRQHKEWKANPPRDQEERSGAREEDRSDEERHAAQPEDFAHAPSPTRTLGARDIYRRLVQRLHPDRGGKWTSTRERLWHDVQSAWNAADTDWLSRIEIEWESANEIIGPHSPLSRLRAAIEELHAARRDAERKLREYRLSPPWRFTRNASNRAELHQRTERNFARELQFLQRQLNHLNRTIAAWEEDWTKTDSRKRRR